MGAADVQHLPSRGKQGQIPGDPVAAALNDKNLRQTNIAAAVGCSDWCGAQLTRRST
jgi:hypothetical protein